MADYTRSTGSSGTMMIRDTGTYVEFWLKAGSSTFKYELPWGYTANGTTGWAEFRFVSGGDYQRLGSVLISDSQTVTFKLGDTGTSGLGGPTDFNVYIDRADPPSPPSAVSFSSLSSTSVVASFSDGANNGAAIDDRRIMYGVNSSGVQGEVVSDRSTLITGLKPGTTYYFWARTHNAKGWSSYGPRTSITTWDVPDAPDIVTLSSVTDDSVVASFTANGDGGTAITDYQITYGVNPSGVQTTVDSDRSTLITGLTPGTTYYFFARAKNAVGWSNWGPRGSVKTMKVPDPPTTPVISSVTQTSVYVTFSANWNGGSPHTGFRIGYGTSSSAPQSYITSDGGTTISGLQAGTTYYFWAQSQNVYGWSSLSGRSTKRTMAGAWIKVGNVWKEAVPYVKVNGVWKIARGWSKIAGVWKETE